MWPQVFKLDNMNNKLAFFAIFGALTLGLLIFQYKLSGLQLPWLWVESAVYPSTPPEQFANCVGLASKFGWPLSFIRPEALTDGGCGYSILLNPIAIVSDIAVYVFVVMGLYRVFVKPKL